MGSNVGQVIQSAGYKLGKSIGTGSYSSVRLAYNLKANNQLVACKIINKVQIQKARSLTFPKARKVSSRAKVLVMKMLEPEPKLRASLVQIEAAAWLVSPGETSGRLRQGVSKVFPQLLSVKNLRELRKSKGAFLSDIIGCARKVSPCSSVSSVSTESASLMASASCTGNSRPAGAGHVRGLSFGRIDELGRFETDVCPEPNKKESTISKVMKRLTTKETKEEEEMAWRVAEKIVRTVTSLTLGEGGGAESEEES
ncbi:hypothetical protein M8J77_017147 [Diaphorina citri]|nr:hypothetical protein M8J77_017147 [Diaphorina citri]